MNLLTLLALFILIGLILLTAAEIAVALYEMSRRNKPKASHPPPLKRTQYTELPFPGDGH